MRLVIGCPARAELVYVSRLTEQRGGTMTLRRAAGTAFAVSFSYPMQLL
jgi:two-component sensor histidine kinase